MESPAPDFDRAEKTILWEQIVEQLLSMLRERKLGPGDRLPPERELAAMVQVSRPSLWKALRTLSMMNVLEVRQGADTSVTSLEPELLVDHLYFVLSLDVSSLMQLLEACKIAETGVVGLATRRIFGDEVAELEAGSVGSRDALHHQARPESFESHTIIWR